MNRKKHVKIVLPCANEGEWLKVTVDSILGGTDYPAYEVVVSANGDTTTDFSFLEASPYRERVRLLRTAEALGVGNSINVALTPGDADYYVFFDAHTLLEKQDWLRRAIACLDEHPEASMVQPAVVNFRYEGTLDSGQVDRSRVRELYTEYFIRWAWPYSLDWGFMEAEPRRFSSRPFAGMAGAGMAVFARQETFHALGGFDREVGGWHVETMDYCVRGWLTGHPMLADPRVRVFHRAKERREGYPADYLSIIHSYLRTAYKYLSPRRRDLAENLFRRLGFVEQVNQALHLLHQGDWLRERAAHFRTRLQTDDWLFQKFAIHEERHGLVYA